AGIAVAAAGGPGDAALAGALAGLSVAERSLLSYARSEESAADAAALTYLERTGQSAAGMMSVFQRLADEQLFATRGADPFLQTHPFAADRLQQIATRAQASPHFGRADPPSLQERHDLVRAKFMGFLGTELE